MTLLKFGTECIHPKNDSIKYHCFRIISFIHEAKEKRRPRFYFYHRAG